MIKKSFLKVLQLIRFQNRLEKNPSRFVAFFEATNHIRKNSDRPPIWQMLETFRYQNLPASHKVQTGFQERGLNKPADGNIAE